MSKLTDLDIVYIYKFLVELELTASGKYRPPLNDKYRDQKIGLLRNLIEKLEKEVLKQ